MIINDGYAILMFDIPMETKKQKRDYNKFRTIIINNGFLMLQKSVYYKYIREMKFQKQIIYNLKSKLPDESNVQCIFLTTKAFDNIETLSGNPLKLNKDIVEEY